LEKDLVDRPRKLTVPFAILGRGWIEVFRRLLVSIELGVT